MMEQRLATGEETRQPDLDPAVAKLYSHYDTTFRAAGLATLADIILTLSS